MNEKEERATDRIRAYPKDARKLRLMAKKKGGKVIPADIIHELMTPKKDVEKVP